MIKHITMCSLAVQAAGAAISGLTTTTKRLDDYVPLPPVVRPAPRNYLPVPLTRERSGCYTANITINGQRVNGILDTGASHVFMSKSTAASLGLFNPVRTEFARLADGREILQIIHRADCVRFGGCLLKDVDVAVCRASGTQVLIGQSVLSRLSYAIDSQANTLTVTAEVQQ